MARLDIVETLTVCREVAGFTRGLYHRMLFIALNKHFSLAERAWKKVCSGVHKSSTFIDLESFVGITFRIILRMRDWCDDLTRCWCFATKKSTQCWHQYCHITSRHPCRSGHSADQSWLLPGCPFASRSIRNSRRWWWRSFPSRQRLLIYLSVF